MINDISASLANLHWLLIQIPNARCLVAKCKHGF